MKVWAISDLHLPGGGDKPMDVFGPQWQGHFEKIRADWLEKVSDDDCVLLPGDLSWAMTMENARGDIGLVGALPGQKVILRGNHDYWWNAIGRVRALLPKGMYAIQNDSLDLCGHLIAGSRLWLLPGEGGDPQDEKIFRRELGRLELSLKDARRRDPDRPILCMTHYPPVTRLSQDTPCAHLFAQYGVSDVVYGHLHGPALKNAFQGEASGVRYHQVSSDGLDFRLYQVASQ